MSTLNLLIQCCFRCPHCGDRAERGSLPLCFNCHWTLISSRSAPLELGDPVDSGWSMYRLNDLNYEILKAWKKKRGPSFDRVVLKSEEKENWLSWIDELPSQPDLIVPMPQNRARSFRMEGSRALLLARWLSQGTDLPVQELLLKEWQLFAKRQAGLDHWYRLINPIPFRMKEDVKIPRSVILVDDFVTTGHTLREAARALKLGGVRFVTVFSLGARIRIAEQSADLLKGA